MKLVKLSGTLSGLPFLAFCFLAVPVLSDSPTYRLLALTRKICRILSKKLQKLTLLKFRIVKITTVK